MVLFFKEGVVEDGDEEESEEDGEDGGGEGVAHWDLRFLSLSLSTSQVSSCLLRLYYLFGVDRV